MRPHWLNIETRDGEIVIDYVDEASLHSVLRRLFHVRKIHNRTLEALLSAYRRAGADELEIMRWTKANRTLIAKHIGWIPPVAQVFRSETHVMIVTPPASIEVLERDAA